MKGVFETTSRGKLYRYLRRRGRPLVPLPADVPLDHPTFLAAYAAAREDDPPPREPGTVAALVVSATTSDRFKGLSPGYRNTLRRHWSEIRAAYGTAPARGLTVRHIEKDMARCAGPRDRLKAWRFLAQHGRAACLVSRNFTDGVEPPAARRTDGHTPWTHEDVAAFRSRWPIGRVERAAMELLLWTGCRIGDAVRIGPGMIDREGVLTYRQGKTGGRAYVPWTCHLPPYATGMEPERRIMHEALTGLPGGQMTFLATIHGQTRSSKALGQTIREAAAAAGLKRSAHGLRKSRATFLAEAGATTLQIGSWTGHESLKEIEHYTRSAGRRAAVMGTEQVRNVAKRKRKGEKHGK